MLVLASRELMTLRAEKAMMRAVKRKTGTGTHFPHFPPKRETASLKM